MNHLPIWPSCDQALSWPRGSKRVLLLLGGSEPLQLWYPTSPREHLFFLPSSAKISPGFYTTLKTISRQSGNATDGQDGGKARWEAPARRVLLGVEAGTKKAEATARTSPSPGKKWSGGKQLPKLSVTGATLEGASNSLASGRSYANASTQTSALPSRSKELAIVSRALMGVALDREAPLLLGHKPSRSTPNLANQPFLSFALAKGCQMLFPQPWTTFWSWHGRAHSRQFSTQEHHIDAEAYDFSSTCRAGELGLQGQRIA